MNDKPLADRCAVVTGASRGLGRHIARALHDTGCTVAVTGRNQSTLAESAATIGPRCHPFVCDQRDEAAVAAFARTFLDRFGAPDILVNNAGGGWGKGDPVADLSLEIWNSTLQTNLTGVFLVTRAFLPAMIERNRGDIFMISSMSGKKGDPGSAAYNASKFGLQGFSQALMYEVRKNNIRVAVLNPSSIDTSDTPGDDYGKGIYLHAADIAATIVHLAALPGRTMIRDMDIYGTNP